MLFKDLSMHSRSAGSRPMPRRWIVADALPAWRESGLSTGILLARLPLHTHVPQWLPGPTCGVVRVEARSCDELSPIGAHSQATSIDLARSLTEK
jgi:hypothetical protein